MPQTLLALLTLLMATAFVLRQHEGAATLQRSIIKTELTIQATSVANDVLEEVGRKAFDEQTIGDKHITSPSALTSPSGFGHYDTPSNDLDDAHGLAYKVYRATSVDTLWFGVNTTVVYTDEADPTRVSSVPTRHKRVDVQVHSLTVARPDTVRLWQRFACGSRCNW